MTENDNTKIAILFVLIQLIFFFKIDFLSIGKVK